MDTGTPEVGVTFQPADSSAGRLSGTGVELSAMSMTGGKATALLVIDDPGRLTEVAGLLVASGVRVETAVDPFRVDDLVVPGHGYSVIVLDVLLPSRDMYRLSRRFRAAGRVPMVIASWADRSDLDLGPSDRIVPHSSTATELAGRVMAVLAV